MRRVPQPEPRFRGPSGGDIDPGHGTQSPAEWSDTRPHAAAPNGAGDRSSSPRGPSRPPGPRRGSGRALVIGGAQDRPHAVLPSAQRAPAVGRKPRRAIRAVAAGGVGLGLRAAARGARTRPTMRPLSSIESARRKGVASPGTPSQGCAFSERIAAASSEVGGSIVTIARSWKRRFATTPRSRARGVVEAPAALHADRLRGVDLDATHVLDGPDRLEVAIGETRRQDRLHGFLADERRDAEHLLLAACAGMCASSARGGEVVGHRHQQARRR